MYNAQRITIGPGPGSIAAAIDFIKGLQYQIDIYVFGASSGGNITATVGSITGTAAAAKRTISLSIPWTGTFLLTLSGESWSATVTEIAVRAVTKAMPALVAGEGQFLAYENNMAIGFAALAHNTTGEDNTANGAHALQRNMVGKNNTGIGAFALQANQIGDDNTAFGRSAGYAPRGVWANRTLMASRQTNVGMESGQSFSTQVDDITTIGYRATAGAIKATAVGSESRADHEGGVALGADTTTTAEDQVMVGDRDVEITSATKGVILRSPNGTRYRLTVNDSGVLSTTAV